MHVPGQRGSAAIAADLGGCESVGLIAGAEAPVFFRNRDTEQARPMQVFIILGRKFRITVVGGGAACEYGMAEFASSCDDRGLLVAQPKRAGIEDRRVEGDLVYCG